MTFYADLFSLPESIRNVSRRMYSPACLERPAFSIQAWVRILLLIMPEKKLYLNPLVYNVLNDEKNGKSFMKIPVFLRKIIENGCDFCYNTIKSWGVR